MILSGYAIRGIPIALIARSRRPRRYLRYFATGILLTGFSVEAAVLLVLCARERVPSSLQWAVPLGLIGGVSLIGYAAFLHMRYSLLLRSRHSRRNSLAAPSWTLTLVLLTLWCLGVVWALGICAQRSGERDAAAEVSDRESVLLFSTDRLGIDGGGSVLGELRSPGEKYRYVYSGLVLLTRTPDRLFLLPMDWKPGRDRVCVVKNGEGIRIDIAGR